MFARWISAAIVVSGISIASLYATDALAAEITVLSANGMKLISNTLVPEFERATGNKVTIGYGEAGILRKRIQDGEAFDLTFLPGMDQLVTSGKIVADSVVNIVHSDFGMAVRDGTPTPDTSSNDALKRLLLSAKSIVYTDPETGGITGVLFVRVLDRLGIADEINKKSKRVSGVLNAGYGASQDCHH